MRVPRLEVRRNGPVRGHANEPDESNFKDKIRARAYPCVERAEMVCVDMGPRATPPPGWLTILH